MGMTPERWQAVKAVLEQALARQPAERAAFLDRACSGDPVLRHEVESLLSADHSASGFLEPPSPSESELIERLQASLGGGYVIERELGGGGMSRVFVATEVALHRRVVIKLLPLELAAGFDTGRFEREIQLAASLQHPHVVPVHATGEAHGVLYYTMPFVEGESLKQRLAREGALPLADAVRILCEIADALSYAHRRGIVHRDLKPANILLEEGHALVADFGIAKAVVAATGSVSTGATLTSTGLVLGTPAYMAPEQAAGGETDHRADLYALGCLAYELLTGQPPFTGPSAQALIGAHIAHAPEPPASRRPGLPSELDRLVMGLLEKRPADRPQSAQEVVQALELLSLPRGRLPLPAILGIYAGCALMVLGVAYLAMVQLGLPDWVMPGALLLLLVGLPIIIATALVQGRRIRAPQGALRGGHARPKHWLTWRRAISGGVLAFSGLGAVVAGYMSMRALGIGPVGTLLAAGVLKQRERVLLADFDNRTRDSLLGTVVTEAFRIDLAGSRIVSLVPPEQVIEVGKRMRRDVGPRLDRALAREVAVRDNVRVVVTGDIAAVGAQYVLSALLLSPQSGEVLAAERETAADSTKIIDTVDRLSKKLRAKIGESLKSLRAEPRLSQVTTSSLEALRKYTQARRIVATEGFNGRAVALYQEAIALDTGFASAYLTLGNSLFNLDERDRAVRALTQAFARRDRLSDLERYEIIGLYYGLVEYEPERAIAAYRALLDINPDAAGARTNLGAFYLEQRQYAAAETLFTRAIQLDREQSAPPSWEDYTNLTWAQVGLGHWQDAELTLEQASTLFPGHPQIDLYAAHLALSRGDYASAEARASSMRVHGGEGPYLLALSSRATAQIAALQGKLQEAERSARDWMQNSAKAGNGGGYLSGAMFIALLESRFRAAPGRGLEVVARALTEIPRREEDVRAIYSDPSSALIDRYDVDWLFIGEYEAGDWQSECPTAGPYPGGDRRVGNAPRRVRASSGSLRV